ncbi:MAG: hypothetical protein CMH27_03645 [Micavibrio sp.]|nr:hypothetical protein [Micavibrio sp.]|tara:strand:+ start:6662 stop:7372 length:711 start_codon:yes stop_codon:yes gene_type:complete
MVQKVAPSLQHYIKGYYETPEMVCKARLNFLMSPPQMTYRPLFGVFEDLLRGQPYNELLAGISKADSRDWVVKNYKEILERLNEEFAGRSVDYVHAVEPSYYNVGKDTLIPFKPPFIYGIDGQKHLPWLSFWKTGPLSGKKLSLFATLVEEQLNDSPDLEDVIFKIYDLSAPGKDEKRGLVVTNLRDIPKLDEEEKVAMLEILHDGYAMADKEAADKPKRKTKQPEAHDPNQYFLL